MRKVTRPCLFHYILKYLHTIARVTRCPAIILSFKIHRKNPQKPTVLKNPSQIFPVSI